MADDFRSFADPMDPQGKGTWNLVMGAPGAIGITEQLVILRATTEDGQVYSAEVRSPAFPASAECTPAEFMHCLPVVLVAGEPVQQHLARCPAPHDRLGHVL